jgi:hypothetical protein
MRSTVALGLDETKTLKHHLFCRATEFIAIMDTVEVKAIAVVMYVFNIVPVSSTGSGHAAKNVFVFLPSYLKILSMFLQWLPQKKGSKLHFHCLSKVEPFKTIWDYVQRQCTKKSLLNNNSLLNRPPSLMETQEGFRRLENRVYFFERLHSSTSLKRKIKAFAKKTQMSKKLCGSTKLEIFGDDIPFKEWHLYDSVKMVIVKR